MPITSASKLNSLAERIIFRGLSSKELSGLAVLKPGKTFADIKNAWETPVAGEVTHFSHEALVARHAQRLFLAGVFEESLVPDDGF